MMWFQWIGNFPPTDAPSVLHYKFQSNHFMGQLFDWPLSWKPGQTLCAPSKQSVRFAQRVGSSSAWLVRTTTEKMYELQIPCKWRFNYREDINPNKSWTRVLLMGYKITSSLLSGHLVRSGTTLHDHLPWQSTIRPLTFWHKWPFLHFPQFNS